jgi:hypothetical protein
MEDIVGLSNELHIAIFNRVMDHLNIMS